MQKHPLAREILNPTCSEKIFLPVHMISVGSLSKNPEYVNDFEQSDTLYGDADPYGGEAQITEDLVDPSGIELPTQIFKNAQEAINLDSFSPEIRPLIKQIFIDRYPNCVSLHSLDAGNLSLTLGYVKLRLRRGEILPRSKRIFHISPSDRRHLSDIIDFLIKYGFVVRSPISPTGNHLYGMASYLIPRSKPNSLGRLIVDYSRRMSSQRSAPPCNICKVRRYSLG
jgi:hypothetical protein